MLTTVGGAVAALKLACSSSSAAAATTAASFVDFGPTYGLPVVDGGYLIDGVKSLAPDAAPPVPPPLDPSVLPNMTMDPTVPLDPVTPEPPMTPDVVPSGIDGDSSLSGASAAVTPEQADMIQQYWHRQLGLEHADRLLEEARRSIIAVRQMIFSMPHDAGAASAAADTAAAVSAAPPPPLPEAQAAAIPAAAAWLGESWAAATHFAEQHLVCHRGKKSLESERTLGPVEVATFI